MNTPAFITVDSRRVRIRITGGLDNPPVLLLHGIGRSLEDWAPQHPRLSAAYRAISLDIPGFGFSSRPAQPITLPVLTRAVAESLDSIGEHRPLHVMGNSLGGALALQLLALQPERVASLVLVNSAAFGAEVTALLRLLSIPVLGRLATPRTTRAAAHLTERLIFADRALASKERIDHALAIAAQPGSGAAMYETVRALVTPRGIRSSWRAELLRAATQHRRPTLLVWGDRDRILPVRHLETAKAYLPHAQTHLFSGTGHMPQIERSSDFAELVLAFLADVTTAVTKPLTT
jgi:pimeloyl-ACP methyl ester carboxylesterase